ARAERPEGPRHQCRGADAVHVIVAMDEDPLAAGDGPAQSVDGALEIENEAGIVELVQTRPEIDLRAIDLLKASRDEQPADRLREVKLGDESLDRCGVRRVGKNPAMTGAYSRCGGSQRAEARGRETPAQ